MGKINDDVTGSALIRTGRITTSDIQDRAVTADKLAGEVTESLLPTATESDSGKVPVVNDDGEWELGAGGGGGDSVMCVTIDTDGITHTADVSYADVVEAFESGKLVLFKVLGSDGIGSLTYDEEYSEVFGGIVSANSGQLMWDTVIYTAEELTLETKTASITWS